MLGGRDRPRLEPAHVVVTAHAVPPPSASVAAAFAPEVWAGRPPPATGRARHLAPRRPLPGQFCAGRKNLFLFCFVWNREAILYFANPALGIGLGNHALAGSANGAAGEPSAGAIGLTGLQDRKSVV